LQHLYRAAGIPSAIFDLEGTFLAGAGSKRICTEFHKKHPEAKKLYLQSDIRAIRRASKRRGEAVCICRHGLMEAHCPVIIDGKPVAYVFTGQFLHERVNGLMIERFRRQAREYGFNEDDYIAALKELPLVSYEKLRGMIEYLDVYVEQLSQAGLAGWIRKEQINGISPNGDMFEKIFESSPILMTISEISSGRYLKVDNCFEKITGYSRERVGKKQLEKQLQQAQKLEAIGALSGGIAHDFNNILGVIIGFTDMVLDDVPPGSRIRTDLEKVLQAGYRGKDLVGQILAFSRQSQDELIPLQLHSIIKEVFKMLRSSLPSTIKIKHKIDGSCGPVEADPSQIHQILMNLCTNAYHAMEDNGGVLTIEYRPATIIPAGLHRYAEKTRARFMELVISDTGVGIDDDIIDLIFDPFFTTKAKGKGTGMGLFIAYGIVQKYNGTISVESTPGHGTAFHVFLPESNREILELPIVQEFSLVGKEHIMLIDDEKLLVEMGKKMLERLGYTVMALTDSHTALEVFSASPDDFDLIITDQTMPDMTGLELAKEMLKKRPSLPIILCTGYSSHVNEEIAKQYGIRKFLYKPVIKSDLANLIRDIFSNTSPLC
jgi:signal transduction histidine kinase/CheY-like chemotaxis protein